MLRDLIETDNISDMKKVWLILGLIFLVAGAYWLSATRLDYSKIVFVLPSSERASSPYFYKKDGDFFLADDLRVGFEKIGYKVEYRFREDYDDLKLNNAGNILYFKGYYDFEHLPEVYDDGRKRVLYLYYIEGLHTDILKEVDAVACASQKLTDELIKPVNAKAYYVPQFTNPERFRPTNDSSKKTKVLFVGSNHTTKGRKSVDYAVQAGADLSVFGKFWDKYITPQYLKGQYIDNDELYKYYAKADIVLNDHREDMRYYGFVSNRIYDVMASGGFVLTDYLPEIEQVYGSNVAMYRDFDEFKQKLDYYLQHPQERLQMIEKAREITLSRFTNDIAAKKIAEIFKNIQK